MSNEGNRANEGNRDNKESEATWEIREQRQRGKQTK